MRFTFGLTVGIIMTLTLWARGDWMLGRILAVPGDLDYARRRRTW